MPTTTYIQLPLILRAPGLLGRYTNESPTQPPHSLLDRPLPTWEAIHMTRRLITFCQWVPTQCMRDFHPQLARLISSRYMGDRWVSSNLMRSTYVWLSLAISEATASMKNFVNWRPDNFAGGPPESSYEGESTTMSNGARTVSCSGCSGSEAAGYLGGSSHGSVQFSSVQSFASTCTNIRVKYENGDSSQRYADVSVNGAASQRIAFLPTNDGNTPGSSSLNVSLNSGTNTVKISRSDGGNGPDIDRLLVPTS